MTTENFKSVKKRVCGDCKYARTDPEDVEDIYFCPFDKEFAFHSGEPCSHEEEYEKAEKESENWQVPTEVSNERMAEFARQVRDGFPKVGLVGRNR